jgi:hypothetical protein
MSVSTAIRRMMEQGFTLEQALSAAEIMEAELAATAAPARTARQERNARYYAAKASERRLKPSEQDVSDGEGPSPKKEMSPAPLKEKTTPSQSETKVSSKKRAARLPADWTLPMEWRQDAIDAGLPADRIELEANRMLDWSLSSPGGAKLDWRATWRNWARGAAERLPKARGSPAFQRTERPDHFANFTQELIDGQDRDDGSDGRNRDDAQGVPILTIDYHRG